MKVLKTPSTGIFNTRNRKWVFDFALALNHSGYDPASNPYIMKHTEAGPNCKRLTPRFFVTLHTLASHTGD